MRQALLQAYIVRTLWDLTSSPHSLELDFYSSTSVHITTVYCTWDLSSETTLYIQLKQESSKSFGSSFGTKSARCRFNLLVVYPSIQWVYIHTYRIVYLENISTQYMPVASYRAGYLAGYVDKCVAIPWVAGSAQQTRWVASYTHKHKLKQP